MRVRTFQRFIVPAFLLVAISIGPAASSQTETCDPGIGTLVGASDAVVRAVPVSMTRELAGGMVYARGEYRVVDRARGAEKAKTVTVEFSCIDMESPSGKDDIGHCPGGEGVVLHGFEESPDGFSAGQEPIPLFLSRPSSSPLDGADVYGDVTFRPFSSCVDGPRDFESGDGEWQYVKKAEAEHRPSSPVAEVTKKAAEKKEKLKKEKSGCG